MSTLLVLAVAAAATVQPACSWDRPGANPYKGTPEAAINRYADLPEKTREKLIRRMKYGQPDEMVDITRDTIHGRYTYDPQIRDMHFGAASVCGTVTRSKWSEKRVEPGAVYCADSHCILVPKICGNVSRISRLTPPVAAVPPAVEPPVRDWGPNTGEKELGLADAPVPDLTPIGDALQPAVAPLVVIAPVQGGATNIRPTLLQEPVMPRPLGALPPFPGGFNPPVHIPPTPVPEPETWAMLLGGLGLMGFMARRRQRGK